MGAFNLRVKSPFTEVWRPLPQNTAAEWPFTAGKAHRDPFNDVEMTVCFESADGGAVKRVPAFWAGDREWRLRFASPTSGTARCRWPPTDAILSKPTGRRSCPERPHGSRGRSTRTGCFC